MIRSLSAPANPEAFGQLIASLRVLAGEREPANGSERELNERLRASLRPEAAKLLLGNLERMPRKVRSRLLGRVAEPSFVAEERGQPIPSGPVRSGIPAVALTGRSEVRGAFADILTRDPDRETLPLYELRYQGFYCQKEMSWDRGSSSDEIYLITSVVDIVGDANTTRTERHPVQEGSAGIYGDVDTYEERIGPVAQTWRGNSDTVSLAVFVMEHDEGDPDAYRDEVDAIVKAVLAVAIKLYPPAAILAGFSGLIVDAVNWLLDTGDDLVSAETVVLPRSMLELYASLHLSPYIGEWQQPVIVRGRFQGFQKMPHVTNLMQHFTTVHRGGGATYVAGFEVVRQPPIERPIIIL